MKKNWIKRGKYNMAIKITKNKSIEYQEKNMAY